ncbi:MAG: thioredoxin domain-containing protein [Patescibacteria group bacterium]
METEQESRGPSNLLNIPTAIVIAGAIIAGAVIWSKGPSSQVPNQASANKSIEEIMKPITDSDYILGNPNAKIKIVEYSDPSCPFCKAFHVTMKRVMDAYGKSGDVAWVYRHYPLDKPDANGRILHPNAGKEAQAMECAGSLGGNEKFWAYTNRLYDITPSVTVDTPGGLDQKELPKIAEFVGINVTDFNNCLVSGKFKEKVEAEFLDGVNIGIQGTPSSIIITPSGKYIPLEGAQPFDNVKQAIDALLSEQK